MLQATTSHVAPLALSPEISPATSPALLGTSLFSTLPQITGSSVSTLSTTTQESFLSFTS